MSAADVMQLRPDDAAAADLQAAARDAYLQAVADGDAPTGAEVGGWFGRSERWGRLRIAECRAADNGNDDRPAAETAPPTGDGTPTVEAQPSGNGAGYQPAPGAMPPSDPGSPAVVHFQPDGLRRSVPDGMWSRRIIRWVTTAAVIVVAACAARSSYEHQRTVVDMAGNHDAAWYLPLSVDGMMLIASLNMLVRRWDGKRAGWLTWTALLLGGAASLAANIAAAPPTWIGRLVAAWSPVCLIVSYELLMQQLPNRAPAEVRQGRQR